jgi:hypothetical protein
MVCLTTPSKFTAHPPTKTGGRSKAFSALATFDTAISNAESDSFRHLLVIKLEKLLLESFLNT